MTGASGLAVPDVHAARRLVGHSAVHIKLVSPGNCPYRPAGQAVQTVALELGPEYPAGHFGQCKLLAWAMVRSPYRPSGHSLHARASGFNAKFLYVPAAHWVQLRTIASAAAGS